jgi:hypothetical protein
MAFKITLKLKPTAKPHLYITQIKELIKNDIQLHPMMRNILLLLKKTRMPYIILATHKEMIFVPEKFMHMEHALEPQLTLWQKIDWSEAEINEYKANATLYLEKIFKLYKDLGYDFFNKEDISEEKVNEIIESTKNQVEKKLKTNPNPQVNKEDKKDMKSTMDDASKTFSRFGDSISRRLTG